MDRKFSASQLFSFKHFDSRLATQLYPSPSAFRLDVIDRLYFTAADSAKARPRQLARPRAEGEAQLIQHPTAERWLSTPGVEIEETPTGWRITVKDLPPEPLRPAEIELPLPTDWQFPANAALSFRYRLILPDPNLTDPAVAGLDQVQPTHLHTKAEASPSAPNRFEEIDVNLRDNNGTLWSVWPRHFALGYPQPYLETSANFTPMFFSRAPTSASTPQSRNQALPSPATDSGSLIQARNLVLIVWPRTLPTIIEIQLPRIVLPKPR